MILGLAAALGVVAGVWIGWLGHAAHIRKRDFDREVAWIQSSRRSASTSVLSDEVDRRFEAAGKGRDEI